MVQAFTDFGIENLIELIRFYKENPGLLLGANCFACSPRRTDTPQPSRRTCRPLENTGFALANQELPGSPHRLRRGPRGGGAGVGGRSDPRSTIYRPAYSRDRRGLMPSSRFRIGKMATWGGATAEHLHQIASSTLG